ncbi:sugar phosphate nucleotidyltransferase [Streptacidiphilus albus]|uniref:sugar phosphate nucleotidyltransferase n=1 Tax=Streptacidiphilus albus TaxID=105425 RepID=UPI0005A76E74|nr:NDP-sugar synthase [Streptacidiphilus albus]
MSEAILLVGGKGTRLRPLTTHTPKPMVRAAGVPFLAHQISRAAAAGVTRIVLATSYLAEVFEEHFGDGQREFGLKLVYVTEAEPLGTGGAIRNAAEQLTAGPNDPVLVFNGDILSGVDIAELVRQHHLSRADVTLHLTRVPDPRAFGLVPTDPDGRVLAFLEKPETPEQIVTDQINAGCYVFTRSVIDAIPTGREVSVERETFPGLLSGGGLLHGVVDSTYWLDLGTPAAFAKGSADLVRGLVDSPALPGPVGDALVLPGAQVSPRAVLSGGSAISEDVHVDDGAVIESSVLLPGARVGADAVVRNSIIGSHAQVGARTVLDGVTLGDAARIGADNELTTGARIACGTDLPDGSLRFSPGTMACTPHLGAVPQTVPVRV